MSIFKIVFILCLINNSALASLTDLSCSQNGTKVLFINGVFIDDKAFASFKIDAENFFGKLDYTQIDINNKELLIPDYRHNQSEGKLRDIAEAYFLYLIRDETKEEMPLELALKLLTASLINDNIQLDDLCKSNNTRETCKEIKKIILNNEKNQTMMDLGAFKDVAFEALVTNKQKLIFVTHSGGNLMADRVRDYVKLNLPKEYYDLTGHVSLARPYNTQHKNVETLVFDQDGVIASLRIAGQNTPDGNVDLIEPCDTFRFLPWFNHGFDCYLGDHKVKQTAYDLPDESPSVDVVKAAIYKVASNLGNNDYSCCKKKPGKFRRNADGSPGGFVSNDLKITTGDIFVQAGAKICATGEILATNDPTKHFFGASVKLNGKFFSDSQFEISGNQVISSETSEIISKLGSTKSFTLKNSEIDGKLELKTNSSVVHPNPIRLSGNFYGSNILNGNISITYVNLRNAILTGNFDLFGVFALNNNAWKSVV